MIELPVWLFLAMCLAGGLGLGFTAVSLVWIWWCNQ
jgi:hypothetical protein